MKNKNNSNSKLSNKFSNSKGVFRNLRGYLRKLWHRFSGHACYREQLEDAWRAQQNSYSSMAKAELELADIKSDLNATKNRLKIAEDLNADLKKESTYRYDMLKATQLSEEKMREERDSLRGQLSEIRTQGLSKVAVAMDYFRVSEKKRAEALQLKLEKGIDLMVKSEAQVLIEIYKQDKEVFNLILALTKNKSFWEMVDLQTLKGRNKGETETYTNRAIDLRVLLFEIAKEL